jgi:hypothetical protein
MTDSEKTITIQIRDRGSKYLYEKAGAAFGVVLIGGMMILLVFIMPPMVTLGMDSLLGILMFVMVRMLLQSGHAEKVIATGTQPGFLLNDEGVSGSIVLLEGNQCERGSEKGQARFSLQCEQINLVEFHPGSSSSESSTPAYMVIAPIGEFKRSNYYYVLRDSFQGCESQIVEALRAHGIKITIDGNFR